MAALLQTEIPFTNDLPLPLNLLVAVCTYALTAYILEIG